MKTVKDILYVLILGLIFNVHQFAQTTNEVNIKASDGSDLVKVKENGNVGIGVDNPNEKLEVDGNVKANNILSVATFSALLTNQADIISSNSFAFEVLKYTDVQENTNSDVFEVTTGGTLKIKKEGHLSIVSSLVCEGIGATGFLINLGFQVIKGKFSNLVADKTQYLENSFNVKVSANNVISITCIPGFISNVPGNNYKTSILSVQWIGVDN